MKDLVERMADAVAEARVLIGKSPSMTVLDLACAIVADAHRVDRVHVYDVLTGADDTSERRTRVVVSPPPTRQTELFAELIVSKGMPIPDYRASKAA